MSGTGSGGFLGRARRAPTRRPALVIRAVLLTASVVLTLLLEEPSSVGWLFALAGVAVLASLQNQRSTGAAVARCLEAVVWAMAVLATGMETSPVLPYLIAPAFAAGHAASVRGTAVTIAFAIGGLLGTSFVLHPDDVLTGLSVPISEWVAIALFVGLVAAWIRNLQDRSASAEAKRYAEAHRLVSQLHAVATRLPGSLDPVTIASGVLAGIGDAAKFDEAGVLVHAGGDQLIPLAHAGADRLAWQTSIRSGTLADAWTTQARWVRAPSLPRISGSKDGGAALVVPLRLSTGPIGVVALEVSVPDAYPRKVATEIARIADEAAVRLATALMFDEIRELATTEERRRLSREIHDGIAQSLASIGYTVDDLAADARSGRSGQVVRGLGQLRDRISELVREVRMSIFELRSEVNRHGGLGAALAEHVRAVGAATGDLTVHLALDEGTARLAMESEAELLRIAQQAIGNARQHAAARNLWVTLKVAPPNATLLVEDDGVGIDPSRNGSDVPAAADGGSDSYGLQIMKERAVRIRATFAVGPREPRGTRVAVQLGGQHTDETPEIAQVTETANE